MVDIECISTFGGCNSSRSRKPARLTKQDFVAGGAAAVTVEGRVVLEAKPARRGGRRRLGEVLGERGDHWEWLSE